MVDSRPSPAGREDRCLRRGSLGHHVAETTFDAIYKGRDQVRVREQYYMIEIADTTTGTSIKIMVRGQNECWGFGKDLHF